MAEQISESDEEWQTEQEEEEEMNIADASIEQDEDENINFSHYAQILPNQEHVHIHQIFDGESYLPMMFVRTEYERLQRESILQEYIKLQILTHTAFSAALQERLKGKQLFFHSLAYREQMGRMHKSLKVKFHEALLPFQSGRKCRVVADIDDRIYCGGFSPSGEQFLIAGQCKDILLFRVSDWKQELSIPVREMRWAVTDAKYTPSGRHVVYSTITNKVRMVSVESQEHPIERSFHLHESKRRSDGDNATEHNHLLSRSFGLERFGVWCFDINAAGTEFIAGTSSNGVVLYDMETETPLCHVKGHSDDVNTVAFVDGFFRSNVFVSGSDDSLIKVWDRRILSETNASPQGVYPGHTDGVTYISSRDDGIYFLSNSKDQSCKLWDLRRCQSAEKFQEVPRFKKPFYWDYRYETYPGRNRLPISHPHDESVMTYRGHCVMQTLIRCYFSPNETTAQNYVYTGSADGRVYIYDVLSGQLVNVFAMESNGVTRDVRWHPSEPMIVSPDFNGKLCVWQRGR